MTKRYLGWDVDFARPQGEPALLAPDSLQWRIYKNPIALAVGGVAAVLLEFAEPRIRSGVWDHSTFKQDPIGRSRRTGLAAMIGVYGPHSAARRVIQGVTNMHARVSGATPAGQAYRALDPDLLDWVSATAAFGFLEAYERFVAPLTAVERRRYFQDGAPVARLYGVSTALSGPEDFATMTARMAPAFEPHPIVGEFLAIIADGPGLPGAPRALRRAFACAAVSILPDTVRARLRLGPSFDLSPMGRAAIAGLAAVAERVAPPDAPWMQASARLGLPRGFLYRSPAAQARLLARRAAASTQTPAPANAES